MARIIKLTRNDLQRDKQNLPIGDIMVYDFKPSAMGREDMCKAEQIYFVDVKVFKNAYNKPVGV